MLLELTVLAGFSAGGVAATKKAREAYGRYLSDRHAAAVAQMQAMEASTRLAAVAWQARQVMHDAVMEEVRSRQT